MAARRILSLLASRIPQKPLPIVTRDFHPSPKSFSSSLEEYTRRFQTLPEISTPPVENPVENGSCSSNPNSKTIELVSSSITEEETVIKHKVTSNLKVSERHDLVMMFTCNVCETRSIKTVCRESYDKGVVLAKCDGCKNLHLIADRLGWFGEPGSVEEFLAARGEEVKKGSTDTFNLTLEDLAGSKTLTT
ncbi:hypothetical protein ACJIZ3_022909 [Penstemon smallii]|uniref:DNL-type domain-containing protein n=1 Tax=Penstemon smallii TaxID=265156 RepID=A0ABD3TPW3_9LAMI